MLKKGDVWFTAVMLRGFMELYQVDGNKVYLDSFARSLDYAWTHAREDNGLSILISPARAATIVNGC